MEKFYKDIIDSALDRCFGLRSSIQKALDTKDEVLLRGCISSLSQQTGLRKEFIKSNLETIKEL